MTRLHSTEPFAAQAHFAQREQGGGSTGTATAALPAKGFCWYCDKPVDNVRRFCSVTCRHDYQEEESEFPQANMSARA
jgi:hypothetical protein